MRALLAAFRIALRAIVRAKLRASLTILGILIGVAAVVVVVALGLGVRQRVLGEVSAMGTNIIYIWPQSSQASGARKSEEAAMTEDDGRAILEEALSVSDVTPFSSVSMQVVASERNVATSVMGTTRSYWKVRSFSFARGESWSESDEQLKAKVCVIGETVREALFGSNDALGQYIRIGKHPFRVVGVLVRKGQSSFGEDQDDRLLMPIGSFRARVMPTTPGRVDQLMASATSERTVDRAVRQIEEIMRQRHHIEEGGEDDFRIGTQAEIRKSQEQIFDTLTVLLSSIAGVSLLVGGIGVMNVMLVSVTERTREIGIRMAIGAEELDILVQFLVEAVTLSLIGGLIGLGVGTGVVAVLASALGWSMSLPMSAIAAALGTSTAIGVVFGFLPARRAARLDPITALRRE
ncbi:ABC transporter permease [Chondromyces apiculatus]|uniref:ABC transporter permease n=1 Tax=Chondromyces apiculatus TaxID=51 RepID=UPI0005C5CDF9|nr:ABC transporter permease [Chondromyces apiculatus]